jgi:GH43 family beta-xylosidase
MINIMTYKLFLFGALMFTVSQCSKSGSKPGPVNPPPNADTTFTNPLLTNGPDPWVIQKDTNYYFTSTFGNKIAIYKTSKMSRLRSAPLTTVWTPPSTGPYSKNIWAPELHFLSGKWYIYFAADDGMNSNHRIYALENPADDPTTGTWEFKNKVGDASDKWAIDATEFDYNGQSYLVWSGWAGDVDVQQNIYIAKLGNPYTISGNRVLISSPDYAWEKIGGPPTVNEGPEILKNNSGRVFLTYSASGCWTDDYSIGMLSLSTGGDPMNPADWTKTSAPVFSKKPENGAYAPGHNTFFKSRDGTEDWIIYHANSIAGQGCSDARNPRMQKFTWNNDGTPNFGVPVKINTPLRKPSGE